MMEMAVPRTPPGEKEEVIIEKMEEISGNLDADALNNQIAQIMA